MLQVSEEVLSHDLCGRETLLLERPLLSDHVARGQFAVSQEVRNGL